MCIRDRHNSTRLEALHEQVIELDNLEDIGIQERIEHIAHFYSLHVDDDRDEILQFIAEDLFFKETTAI